MRRLRVPRGSVLLVDVDGALATARRRGVPWQKASVLSLEALGRVLGIARKDPRIAGLLVTLRRLQGGGAAAASLRELLAGFKSEGKRVVAYLPNGASSHDLHAVSAADELILGPGSSVGPLGFASVQPYLGPALERAGIEAEVLAHGRFKTAGEQLLRGEMSDAQREQVSVLLENSASELASALSRGRGVPEPEVRRWFDEGPWSADAAVRERIADAVLYEDELPARLGAAARTLPWSRYAACRTPLFRPLRRPGRLAVIEISGVIAARETPGLAAGAAEPRLRKLLKQVRDDRRVLGVLLAINSRGGSALASERLWREVRLIAQAKPVVAYLSDVAASGGYMIAAAAACIVAQPLTVTGSIGVVSGRLLVSGLLERLGVRMDVAKIGARADMLGSSRRLTPDERGALERQLDDIYRRFVDIVAEGRGRSRSDIEQVAEGRVWSGRDALRHGLVDRLGGLDEALAELRTRIGPAATRAEPVLVGARRLRLARLAGASAAVAPGGLVEQLAASGWGELATLSLTAADEVGWLWCDFGAV